MNAPDPKAFLTRRNYYVAGVTELAAPLLRALGRLRTGPPTPRASWRRGLILSHSHLGDVLYRTCSLETLQRALPTCEWTYLVTPQGAEILGGGQAAVQPLAMLDTETGELDETVGLRVLRERRFDAVLCTNTYKIGNDLALALRCGIPNRVAFGFKGWSGLATHAIQPRYPRPYADYFRQMVAEFTGIEARGELRPKVYPDSSDRREALEKLGRMGVQEGGYIVCAPCARQARGTAPSAVFAVVLGELAKAGTPILLCGSAADRAELTEIARAAHIPPRVLAGDLTIRALVVVLQGAMMSITQDSGPRHLANAASVPVAFFRNLAFPKVEAGRYCASETDLLGWTDAENLDHSAARDFYRRTDLLMLADRVLEFVRG